MPLTVRRWGPRLAGVRTEEERDEQTLLVTSRFLRIALLVAVLLAAFELARWLL
jgi:hypothetical protein